MKITLLFFGKAFKSSLPEGVLFERYLDRLTSLAPQAGCSKVSVIYKDFDTKTLMKDAYYILLDERGKEYTTQDFAHSLHQWALQHPSVVFVVGDAYGIPLKVKQKADATFALSQMTWPHQWARFMLVEQIYRSFSFLLNKPYHHA